MKKTKSKSKDFFFRSVVILVKLPTKSYLPARCRHKYGQQQKNKKKEKI